MKPPEYTVPTGPGRPLEAHKYRARYLDIEVPTMPKCLPRYVAGYLQVLFNEVAASPPTYLLHTMLPPQASVLDLLPLLLARDLLRPLLPCRIALPGIRSRIPHCLSSAENPGLTQRRVYSFYRASETHVKGNIDRHPKPLPFGLVRHSRQVNVSQVQYGSQPGKEYHNMSSTTQEPAANGASSPTPVFFL